MKVSHNSDTKNSIFHFAKMETAFEFILPNRNLRLNLLENTHDPRENKSFGFGAINAGFDENEQYKQHSSWNNLISQKLRNNTKVLCFSTDYYVNNDYFDGYNLPRMWAQYGQNHLGICFDIDLEKFKEENKGIIKKCHLDKVEYFSWFDYPYINYDGIKNMGIDNYIKEFRNANLKKLFFSKFIDWESEREFRVIYFDNTTDDVYLKINDSLKRIILGVDFKECYLPSIFRLSNGIRIEKINYFNNKLISIKVKEDYI